jgi:hypothetical protein
MQVTGSTVEEGVTLLQCTKPGTTLSTQYAVNGLVRVPPNKTGVCYRRGDLPIAYDAGSPAPGERWGIRAGQWSLSRGYPSIATVHGIKNAASRILCGTLGPVGSVVGACAIDLPPLAAGVPGAGTITVYVWNGSALVPAAPATTFTGHNASTSSIPAGTVLQFVESDGLWLAVSARDGEEGSDGDGTVVHGTAVDDAAPGAIGTVTTAAGDVEAINQSRITFFDGDPLSVYQEEDTWYAIPAGTQIFPIEIPGGSPIAAGDDVSVTLPDGQSVDLVNRARVQVTVGSHVHAYLNRATGEWLMIRTDDLLRRRVKGQINMAAGLKGTDANATIDSITTFDGDAAPTITTAANPLKLWGADNDAVLLEEATYAGGASTWFVAAIQPPARVPRMFKAKLNGALARNDANATIDTVAAIDGGSAPSPTTASNYLHWSGADNDDCLIVEELSGGSLAYLLFAVAWDVITPVVDVDTSGTALRQTKQDHIGKANAAAASPATIDSGTDCPEP